jgi:Spy/CpxP family protein refolding chaperone
MNKSKLKIAAYLFLIFAAGALSGGSIAWKKRVSAGIHPPSPGQRPAPGEMCDFLIHEWRREGIDLNEEQISKIKPILEVGMKEVRAVQERSVQEVRGTMQKTDNRIAEELTPEQKEKFQEWQRKRDEHRPKHQHFGPGPRGEREGPPPEHAEPPPR